MTDYPLAASVVIIGTRGSIVTTTKVIVEAVIAKDLSIMSAIVGTARVDIFVGEARCLGVSLYCHQNRVKSPTGAIVAPRIIGGPARHIDRF